MKVIEYGEQNSSVVMLLHGGGLSWRNFRTEAELLGESYHVVVPILDGHAESDHDFMGIEENAKRIVSFIDEKYDGSIMLIGGLSLGAQILTEMLSLRKDICNYAIIESALILPSKITNVLIKPMFAASYGLIRREWFSKYQFKYLRIKEDLYEEYYRDSCKITKENMISFLEANTLYQVKKSIQDTQAKVRVVVGDKEQGKMKESARILHEMISGSVLEVKQGLYHGEYSLNQPKQYVEELLDMIS